MLALKNTSNTKVSKRKSKRISKTRPRKIESADTLVANTTQLNSHASAEAIGKDLKVRPRNINHQRGLSCELLVAQSFAKMGYAIVEHRLKTPYAEIDLLLESEDCYLLVEVKSCSSLEFAIGKVRRNQKQRLTRAFIYLSERLKKPLRIAIVLVADDELHILEDVLG